MEKYYKLNYFSGGLSESEFLGPKGSFSRSFGIDIFSTPGLIKCADAPIKESSGTVVDFCKFAVDSSSGTSYWFGDTGYIYNRKISNAGVASWGTVYKHKVDVAINGAGEFDGYIYWTSGGSVNRISVNGNWPTDIVLAWGTISSSPTYHPMVDMGLYLLIGNNTTMASVTDTGTLVVNGLPDVTFNALPSNYSISSLYKYGIDVLIGTSISGGASGTKLLRWDLASPSYTQEIDVPETTINCFLTTDNNTYLQAGGKGNIYRYDGIAIEPYKKIQIIAESSLADIYTYPQSSANFGGIGYLGITNATTSTLPGLYALGRKNSSYPVALCHEFVPSYSTLGATYGNYLHIGAVLSGSHSVTGIPYLVFAYKNTSTSAYGVDAIFNPTTKNASSYIETQSISGDREKQKTFQNYNISYKAKPANTDISLDYYKNYSTGTSGAITLTDKSGYNKLFSEQKIDTGAMKFRLSLNAYGANTPEVSDFYTSFNERDVL